MATGYDYRDRAFSKCHRKIIEEKYTMSETELISHTYMHEFGKLIASDENVQHFIVTREQSGLKVRGPKGEPWTALGEYDLLITALNILDGEAIGMYEKLGWKQ